jgi:hypothetical protein
LVSRVEGSKVNRFRVQGFKGSRLWVQGFKVQRFRVSRFREFKVLGSAKPPEKISLSNYY